MNKTANDVVHSVLLDPFMLTLNYCFLPVEVYDLYGGYGAMYSGVGGMLVQAYPGGPLVAAVPVPVPVQPVDWYRAPNGEVSYVYALAYPNMAEQAPMEENSPRSNSVESFQVTPSNMTA